MADGSGKSVDVVAIVHEENGVFGVSFPDFPGCITGADTLEQAISKAGEVLAFHVAGILEDGGRFPMPRSIHEMKEDPDVTDAIRDGAILASVCLGTATLHRTNQGTRNVN